MGGEQRNLFIALGLMLVIMLGYQTFITGPAQERQRSAIEAAQVALLDQEADPNLPAALTADPTTSALDRPEALATSQRVTIDAPSVEGSFSLTGARFDDLRLRRHTVDVGGTELISLLNPIGGDNVFYVRDGWQSPTPGFADLPGGTTAWTLLSGSVLTANSPVVIGYDSPSGLHFERTISVDDNYLFTVSDVVTNTTGNDVELQRYGLVRDEGMPTDLTRNMSVFEGALAVVDGRLIERKFSKLEDGEEDEASGVGGWAGITMRYWMAAAIPDQSRNFTARFRTIERAGIMAFESSYVETAQVLPAGGSLSSTSHIFAGAKELDVLQAVQNDDGIQKFDMAINWGWLWFLTRPFVWLLHHLEQLTGNVGLAILALTLMVKIVMFPLANRAFASMAKMKTVQPKVAEIKERYAADQQKQQQAMMELYKKEKINPLAGCLPILPQIPIFFALYQTLFNAIEMRHAPFFGWIHDLAAPDPTTMWNLFGLLPFDPSALPLVGGLLGGVLAIGVWPILMGFTMAAQQALNPPPADATQAKIFAFLPFVFTIMLAQFASGLVIYWAWNNALSVTQQYIIMRRHGNETQLDKLIAHLKEKIMGGRS
ncbi:membrane protein insertase YidC [uncultured Maricaulis sp.]|uniref:membrane protein insertase YidC n=1 Tax=uncultured Maricaulis sp. TaxID=174710 RepID=UPI0030D97BA4|tara:strand:- start:275863 stop:277665 length:1803 start_codon:yes stop_codon:yes gene_type:complete